MLAFGEAIHVIWLVFKLDLRIATPENGSVKTFYLYVFSYVYILKRNQLLLIFQTASTKNEGLFKEGFLLKVCNSSVISNA